jgi:hypothetical protein
MTLRHAFVVAMLAAALVLSASAFASTATVSPSTPSTYTMPAPSALDTATAGMKSTGNSRTATMTYDLTWTLPTAGKSGCTVCHNDKDLVRVKGGRTVSLYVNTEILQASAHRDIPCTGCHLDFAYKTPHANVSSSGEEWRTVAKLSCKNCHQVAFSDYTSSAHSPSGQPGQTTGTIGAPGSSAPGIPKPLCGDCHGGHSIPASNNVEARRELHASGIEMCGPCHVKETANYSAYYHGSAYKRKAPDAPSCWDCHSTHKVLPSTDRNSTVYSDRLFDTCHKCHSDPGDGYVGYAQLVHGKQNMKDSNPVYTAVESARSAVSSASDKFKSMFQKGSK